MQITTVGLDLAKNVFQVHGVDAIGQVVLRKSLRRSQMLPFFTKLPPCLVGIEAANFSGVIVLIGWAQKRVSRPPSCRSPETPPRVPQASMPTWSDAASRDEYHHAEPPEN